MRILIVEDETTSAKRLKRLILQLISNKACIEIIHEESLEAALNLLEKTKIDLLFLGNFSDYLIIRQKSSLTYIGMRLHGIRLR